METLVEYLSRGDVSLKIKIQTLINQNLSPSQFISLGEALVKNASDEEKARYPEQIHKLTTMVKAREARRN